MTAATQRDGVSFCIPNWNHRTFFGRSIGSALRAVRALEEAGFAGEVIVVDDASRDGSQRALAALALAEPEGRVDVVLSSANRGLPATRMAGIGRARFSHVCLLDADNEVSPAALVQLLRAALATRAALIYANLVVVREGVPSEMLSNDAIDDAILENNYVDAFCLVDRRAVVEFGGYRTDLDTHEDWELLLHLISEGQEVVFVPIVLGYYYVEGASMVQTTKVEHQRFRRVFNQRRIGLPRAFRPRRTFHPDLGWIA